MVDRQGSCSCPTSVSATLLLCCWHTEHNKPFAVTYGFSVGAMMREPLLLISGVWAAISVMGTCSVWLQAIRSPSYAVEAVYLSMPDSFPEVT